MQTPPVPTTPPKPTHDIILLPESPLSPLSAYDGLTETTKNKSPEQIHNQFHSNHATAPNIATRHAATNTPPSLRVDKTNSYPQEATANTLLDEIATRLDTVKLSNKLLTIVVTDAPAASRKQVPVNYNPPPPVQHEYSSSSLNTSIYRPVNKLSHASRYDESDDVVLLDDDEPPKASLQFISPRKHRNYEAAKLKADTKYEEYQQSMDKDYIDTFVQKHNSLKVAAEKKKAEYKKMVDDLIKEQRLGDSGKGEAVPKLTKEQIAKVQEVLSNRGRSDEVLTSGFSVDLKREDIRCLRDGEWLNDEVINFYINLLLERNKASSKLKTYIFNTHFYALLYYNAHKYDYSRVRRWSSKIGEDVFKLDKIVVPIHLGQHWCLAVINFIDKQFEYYDSLLGNNEECLNVLRMWVRDEAKKGNVTIDLTTWKNVTPKDIPTQRNGYDCGVFMLRFAERSSKGSAFNFSQESMPDVRKHMVLELLNKKAHG